jgi:7,8-dihydro-6-hydroxymethylpterin-pyrophosphokinase
VTAQELMARGKEIEEILEKEGDDAFQREFIELDVIAVKYKALQDDRVGLEEAKVGDKVMLTDED